MPIEEVADAGVVLSRCFVNALLICDIPVVVPARIRRKFDGECSVLGGIEVVSEVVAVLLQVRAHAQTRNPFDSWAIE
jgi:hypothetical protein